MKARHVKHIAIIPDGNRRWAKKNNLPTFQGHLIASEKILPEIIETAYNAGVEYLTFWALSTENLKSRPKKELDNLFMLMKLFLKKQLKKIKAKNIKLKIIGNVEELPKDIKKLINKAILETSNNNGFTLVIGLNYGGRDEIIRAFNKLQKSGEEINKNSLNKFLDTVDIPDPDFIIRTGGEKRVSGFLLWQAEYSELTFIDDYFPEMTKETFQNCLIDFNQRERRFGA